MSRELAPETYFAHMDTYKRTAIGQKIHPTRRLCVDSRWPYTADLTPAQIACMRDTFCGKRRKPSAVQRRCDYDRIFHPEQGWDQFTHKDTKRYLKDIQCSARDEDKERSVVVEGNAVYGKYNSIFVDFANNLYPRTSIVERSFYKIGPPLPGLPPIRDFNFRRPHPD